MLVVYYFDSFVSLASRVTVVVVVVTCLTKF